MHKYLLKGTGLKENKRYTQTISIKQGHQTLTVRMKHPRNKSHCRWLIRIILSKLKCQLERT